MTHLQTPHDTITQSGALLTTEQVPQSQSNDSAPRVPDRIFQEEIVQWEPTKDKLVPNSFQLRENFDPKRMDDLEASMKERGQIHFIVGRWLPGSNKTIIEIGDGERRARIHYKWGTAKVTIVVRDYTDEEMARMAIDANRVRESNNPIELAKAWKRIRDTFSISVQEISERANRSRPSVSNTIRLLDLPEDVQTFLSNGSLTTAQALPMLRYIHSPRLVSWWAKKVVANDIASKTCEKGILVDWQEENTLVKAGIVCRPGGYNVDADFKAHPELYVTLNSAHSNGRLWCIDADYMNEMARNYRAAQVAEEDAERARRALQNGDTPSQPKPVPVGKDGKPLVELRIIGASNYKLIDAKPVSTCTPECACRGQALDNGEVVEICTNRAVYDEKSVQETKRKNARTRERTKANFNSHLRYVDGARLHEAGAVEDSDAAYEVAMGRMIAVLADGYLRNQSRASLRATCARLKLHADVFDPDKYKNESKDHVRWNTLAGMYTPTLVAMAFEAGIRHDLENVTETYGYRNLLDWFAKDLPTLPPSWAAIVEAHLDLDLNMKVVRWLINTPVADVNFKTHLEAASAAEIERAIFECEMEENGFHQTRLPKLRRHLSRLAKRQESPA